MFPQNSLKCRKLTDIIWCFFERWGPSEGKARGFCYISESYVKPGFLHLGTTDILDQIRVCVGGRGAVGGLRAVLCIAGCFDSNLASAH